MTNEADEVVKQAVEAALAAERGVDETAIGVAIEHGVVTLTGRVPDWTHKHAAERAVLRVRGVRDVANEIVIQPSWDHTRTNADIARSVRHAFASSEALRARPIHCTVADLGSVTLIGATRTVEERAQAERLARAVAGVLYVTNDLSVDADA